MPVDETPIPLDAEARITISLDGLPKLGDADLHFLAKSSFFSRNVNSAARELLAYRKLEADRAARQQDTGADELEVERKAHIATAMALQAVSAQRDTLLESLADLDAAEVALTEAVANEGSIITAEDQIGEAIAVALKCRRALLAAAPTPPDQGGETI